MSQIELYQSVLSKLGQLPVQELVELDAYLSLRLRRKPLKESTKTTQSNVSKVAGAWKDWNNADFEDFLGVLRQSREEMFADRGFQV